MLKQLVYMHLSTCSAAHAVFPPSADLLVGVGLKAKYLDGLAEVVGKRVVLGEVGSEAGERKLSSGISSSSPGGLTAPTVF